MDGGVLFGRRRELALLAGALDAAVIGSGRLVLLSGEAGIGKTTLLRSLAAAAEQRGARLVAGHCYDLTETPPYGPWDQALSQLGVVNAAFAGDQSGFFASIRQLIT